MTPAPATLVLRAKCQVRDADTLGTKRHVRQQATGSTLATQTLYLRREDLVLTHVPTYDASTYADFPAAGVDPRVVTAVTTNVDEINARCDDYIDAALGAYEQSDPRQVRVAGIWPIDVDGVIAQVTYEVGPSGATTTIARESEPSNFTAGYWTRRQSDGARQAVAAAQHAPQP